MSDLLETQDKDDIEMCAGFYEDLMFKRLPEELAMALTQVWYEGKMIERQSVREYQHQRALFTRSRTRSH